MSYEMCSSRCCNVCLCMEVNMQVRGAIPSENSFSKPLMKCSGCQLVSYCGREHQRLDWHLHRAFCHGIKKLMKRYKIKHPFLISEQPYDRYTMERAIIQVKYILRKILKRSLEPHEHELTSFPAYCEVCFSFNVPIICTYCIGTSYCSSEHAEHDRSRHMERCGQLQLYYCPYKILPRTPPEKLLEELNRRVPDILKTNIIGAYECLSAKVIPQVPIACMDNYQIFSSIGDFSCMGSVLFSLEFIDVSSITCQKFVIFILGAVVEQDLWFRQIHTKWFFLQYQKFTRLELYFIGPDVVGAVKREFTFSYQGADRTVLCESHRMLYQEFTKINRTKPSLIISFNCGFSENSPSTIEDQRLQRDADYAIRKDTWSGGISKIIKNYGLPIVFTSITRLEADLDFGAIQRIALTDRVQTQVRRLFDVRVNPYRDIRPMRNWKRANDDDIMYRNGYIQGVTTHLFK